MSEMAGKLLVHNLNLKEIVRLNNVPILIDAYLEQVAHKDKKEMEKNVQISHVTLNKWLRGKTLPEFQSIVKLCYCSGVSLFDLVILPAKVFRSIVIKFHALPESISQSQKHRKPTRIDLIKLRQQLEDILDSKSVPPLSMRAVGRLLDHDPNAMRDHFPETCKAISHKYLNFRQEQSKKGHQKIRTQIKKTILKIDSEGIYPSHNKVMAHLGRGVTLQFGVSTTYWREGMEELKKRKT